MKKNLLFIMNKLVCGGAEKSLISLLETIDYSKYNVDLFLFAHEGMLMNKIPKNVSVLQAPEIYKYFDMSLKKALIELVSKGEFRIAFYRCILGYLSKTEKSSAAIEQKFWKYLSRSLDNVTREYDVAIGFLEKNPIYFCVDRVIALQKIGWIHTDYNKLEVNFKKEQEYLNKLDHVITVSDELVTILKNIFPKVEGKVKCVNNIVSSKSIRKMAEEKIVDFKHSPQSIKLISVCRLAKEKGLDITLNAVEILVNRGYCIDWYIVGEGNLRKELEKSICEKNLMDRVHLLGAKENPYPYIKKSDIFIQTSRFEGKSISIDEAKILLKPILISNFNTASNHITHKKNGIISKMDSNSVANDLEMLINDKALRSSLQDYLEKEDLGTEGEIKKLYELVRS